jgi:hypothetical protein
MRIVERSFVSRARAVASCALLWASWAFTSASSGLAHADAGRRLPSIAAPAVTSVIEQPVVFEPNRGQLAAVHRFVGRSRSGLLLLGDERMQFVAPAATARWRSDASRSSVGVRFLGAAGDARPDGIRPLASASNYFTGDGAADAVDVPHFGGVRYREIYPGIDAIFYGHGAAFEFDLLVRAGGDPAQIRIAFDGADGIALDADGDLVLRTPDGVLRQRVPAIYQVRDGERVAVRGRYLLEPDHSVSIELGEYDPSLSLVIDPVIAYSTYLGGSGDDEIRAVTADANGNVYVAGSTTSLNFPLLNPYQSKGSGNMVAFVSKFSPAGTLLYSTFLVPAQNNWALAWAIAVDAAGSAYVAGPTTDGFPTTRNAYQPRRTARNASFLTKLSAAGNQLAYSTYVNYTDTNGIAVDAAGNAFIAGNAYSGFATTAGTFQTLQPGLTSMYSPFVLKMNTNGTAPVYSTYVGGSTFDILNGVAIDAMGNAVVTGQALSPDFPLASALQSSFAAPGQNGHVFVAKLDPTGSSLLYSTFLGGSGSEEAVGVALDGTGAAYIAGTTSSTDFPLVQPFQATSYQPNYVSFVAKLSPAGDRLVYSTYLGGTCGGVNYPYCSIWQGDEIKAIAVDTAGHSTVVGNVRSPYFPLADSLEPAIPAKGGGIFVTRFTASGSALYSTLIGGGAVASGAAGSTAWTVAIDKSGNTWIGGATPRTDFPLAGQSWQSTLAGGVDAVLVKLAAPNATLTMSSSDNPAIAGTPVTLRAQVTGAQSGGTVSFASGTTPLGSATVTDGVATLVANLSTGIRKVQAIYRDGAREGEADPLYQVVNPRSACP